MFEFKFSNSFNASRSLYFFLVENHKKYFSSNPETLIAVVIAEAPGIGYTLILFFIHFLLVAFQDLTM